MIYGSSFPSVLPSVMSVMSLWLPPWTHGPWGRATGEIKLLDFSVQALQILSVIDICSSSVSHPKLICECPYCPYTHPGCPCGIPYILDASAAQNIHKRIAGPNRICYGLTRTGLAD